MDDDKLVPFHLPLSNLVTCTNHLNATPPSFYSE